MFAASIFFFCLISLLSPLASALGTKSPTATQSPSRPRTFSSVRTPTKSVTQSPSRPVSFSSVRTLTKSGSPSRSRSKTPARSSSGSPTRCRSTTISISVSSTTSITGSVSKHPSWTVSASSSLKASLSPITTSCPLGYAGASTCKLCPIGSYCPLSSVYPTLCPAGTYGSTTGLSTSACSGNCTATPGYFCPPGSTFPTATLICTVGAYCAGGSAANMSCFPVTACTVVGLSVQPPCYWNVSALAGRGTTTPFADGMGTLATFQSPCGVAAHPNGLVYVGDSGNSIIRAVTPAGMVITIAGSGVMGATDGVGAGATFNRLTYVAINPVDGNIYCSDSFNQRIRRITPVGVTSTFVGGGSGPWADGIGTNAAFSNPRGIKIDAAGFIYLSDSSNHRIRKISPLGVVTTLAGTGSRTPFTDGAGSLATFNFPEDVAVDSSGNVFVADYDNTRLRLLAPNGNVTTVAGSATGGGANGLGTLAQFAGPSGLTLTPDGIIFQTDYLSRRLRMITSQGLVTTVAGTGFFGYQNGFGTNAVFDGPKGITLDATGIMTLVDSNNHRIRQIICVPCPASFYCSSGGPVPCTIGSQCPLSSVNPTPCPPGKFSNTLGAALCTPCLGGTYSPYFGQTSCRLTCEPGYYCPPGSSSMTPCGTSNYCPQGSSYPTPCPLFMAVDAALGPANGPAYDVDTAACLAHCYSGGPGQTSHC